MKIHYNFSFSFFTCVLVSTEKWNFPWKVFFALSLSKDKKINFYIISEIVDIDCDTRTMSRKSQKTINTQRDSVETQKEFL